jgi:two-component system KDP operon response regulator KdpE
MAQVHPDVVLIDLSIPDRDGQEVFRELRTWIQVPTSVRTVRAAEAEKVAALEVDADDSRTKPFSIGAPRGSNPVTLNEASNDSQ